MLPKQGLLCSIPNSEKFETKLKKQQRGVQRNKAILEQGGCGFGIIYCILQALCYRLSTGIISAIGLTYLDPSGSSTVHFVISLN